MAQIAKDVRPNKFVVPLFVLAWLFYIVSFFIPCVYMGYIDENSKEMLGIELFFIVMFPWDWIAIFPAIYFVINILFLWSLKFRFGLRIKKTPVLYCCLISVGAAFGWHCLFFIVSIENVYVGGYLWAIALTLIPIAVLLPNTTKEAAEA